MNDPLMTANEIEKRADHYALARTNCACGCLFGLAGLAIHAFARSSPLPLESVVMVVVVCSGGWLWFSKELTSVTIERALLQRIASKTPHHFR